MFIAIEGVTGIGKSTVQEILSRHYAAQRIVQEFENHPYLATSHAELRKYALEREMIFLFMAYHQLKHLDTENKLVISDFIFEKLKVFAINSLSNEDLNSVFLPCLAYLRRDVRKPDLVIRLIGSPHFALSNVRQRNRTGESYLSEEDLVDLDITFNRLFDEYRDHTVVTVNAEEHDLRHDKFALQELLSLLECTLPGLHSYRLH